MKTKEAYIEDVGLFYEKYGLPKMAGRILGCLMVFDWKHYTFNYIQDQLKASKGSISSDLNLLLRHGMIEKKMITCDRKSYYRIAINSLEKLLDAKIESITAYKELLQQGVSLNSDQNVEKVMKIQEIIDYYEFLEMELPLLRLKWHQLKKK